MGGGGFSMSLILEQGQLQETIHTTVPGDGNQLKMTIHPTKHIIGSCQRLLQTVARKVASVVLIG